MLKISHPPGIYGVIHVSIMNNWKTVLHEQLDLIEKSGLFGKCEKIYACILGKLENFKIFEDRGIAILGQGYDMSLGDVFGVRCLYDFSKLLNNSKLWFIHSKGVSRPQCERAIFWRQYMQHFVIERHEDCIEALNQGSDCCGVQWRGNFFAGNFWWANSAYCKKLPKDVLTGMVWDHCHQGYRWAAEFNFIGRGNPKVKCFDSGVIGFYIDPNLDMQKILCQAYEQFRSRKVENLPKINSRFKL